MFVKQCDICLVKCAACFIKWNVQWKIILCGWEIL